MPIHLASGTTSLSIIIHLLVRTTIRSLGKEAALQTVLQEAGMVNENNLSVFASELTSDKGWVDAVADVDFVLHTASPVQPGHVMNEDNLIVPANPP